MADIGWIKLHRKLQECWIWRIDKAFDERSAWIDLLLSANHKDVKLSFNGELILVKRGQFITSVRKLSEKWKWNKDKTLKFLRLLESDKMIKRDSDRFRTLITIENYEVYQDLTNADRTPISERASEQTSERTSERSSDKQECKELKNEKNNSQKESITNVIPKKKFTPPTVSEVEEYCQERQNCIDAQSFVDFYESKGWMVGKNRMKDWKAAVRTWERQRQNNPKVTIGKTTKKPIDWDSV